ncbi:hypothetical protein QTH09_16155 [Clostridium perfringens]|nr:hypothetical protein [Clostridium perfringens]
MNKKKIYSILIVISMVSLQISKPVLANEINQNIINEREISSSIYYDKDISKNSQLIPLVNIRNIYFNYNGLVIDGNFGFSNHQLNNYLNIKLTLRDSNNNIVNTINTLSACWGEKNTGFQGIISNEILSELKIGKYSLYAETYFNGNNYNIKLSSNSNMNVSNIINTFKISATADTNSIYIEKLPPSKYNSKAEIKNSYWDCTNFVINGVVNIDNQELNKSDSKILVIKDSYGNKVSEIDTFPVNWYSNKCNFNGFQAIIPESIIKNLSIGKYSLEIRTKFNGIVYSNILKSNNKNINEEKTIKGLTYRFFTDSENNLLLTIAKKSLLSENIANNIYWQNDLNSFFINGSVIIDNKKLQPSQNKHTLILKNSKNEEVYKSLEVSDGWNNENSYQAKISQIMIDNLEPGTYTVYIGVDYNGKLYEIPVSLSKSLVLNTNSYQTNRYIVKLGTNVKQNLTIIIK